MTSLVEIRKENEASRRRKEQAFGLTNSSIGGGIAALGTRSVYREQRALRMPKRQEAYEAKRAAKVTKPGRLGPLKDKIAAKLPAKVKRYAAPAAVAGAVGTQLFNVGADAQQASYFGRELAHGNRSRSAGEGQQHKVGKAFRSYDPEADRRHRLGIYEGAGALVGGAGVAATGVDLRRRTKGKVTAAHFHPKALKALAGRNKLLLAGAGATAAGTGTAVAARRSYLHDRNQPWT